jgi:predicted negative regulator of RcsB-dependent stress response
MSELDELEQGERVRAWLRHNGSTLVTGVALGVALIFGWQWWQNSNLEHRVTAATQFEALTEAAQKDEREAVSDLAESLGREHADTPYALLAKLRLSTEQVEAGELDAGLQTLRSAEADSRNYPGLENLVTLRIARLQNALGRHEEALATLGGVKAYEALVAELRGDALRALDRDAEAYAAYEEALTRLDAAAPSRTIVQMKRNELASAGPEA